METKNFTTEFGGRELKVEFSDMVEQAHGSCLVRYGDTVVLATAVMGKNEKEGDFFPLTVDFEEKFYATGKILGSRFQKREGRPTDEAILSGRIVDRTIRPLFDGWIRNEIQVVVTVLSIGEDDPDVLAVLGASIALGTSMIPWNGPVSAVRVGKNAEFEINPTYTERNTENYQADILVCGRDDKINMIEIGSSEVAEEEILKAIELAKTELNKLQKFQEKIISEIGKEKVKIPKPKISEKVLELFEEKIQPIFMQKVFSGNPGKEDLSELVTGWNTELDALEKSLKDRGDNSFGPKEKNLAKDYIQEKIDEVIHEQAIKNKKRPDGRGMDELRPLFARVGGISKILHGTGLFYRGATHVLSVLTLGSPGDAQMVDTMEVHDSEKRFMLHYNFPPYSTGEVGRMGGTNRRMVGHGALAEKALVPVLPNKEKFPYVIRLVAESMSSNGSTSMASVCAGTLALMDGGVPILRPVAGIASGLMMDGDDYVVLTDIQGPEDHHGDMDFKVAGTTIGVTAVQMDVKVDGIPLPILREAFEKAKIARLQILKVMTAEIAAPREKISDFAPHIVSMHIKPDQIGAVIGTGGKVIKEIKEKTGAEIDIDDDGTVYITGLGDSCEQTKKIIEQITWEPTVGERFRGEVVKITEFGAFVRIPNGVEGLLHISEICPQRIKTVDEKLKVGDIVPVVVREVDDRGRLKFSIKEIAPDWFDKVK
jgi:polyribonucleotide nucleotidyltransferase